MCNRPVRVGLWRWLTEPVSFCPPSDLSGCLASFKAMTEEPPEPEPEDPDWGRPDDLWVCSGCRGSGEVPVRQDWETGALEFADCARCGGVGAEP